MVSVLTLDPSPCCRNLAEMQLFGTGVLYQHLDHLSESRAESPTDCWYSHTQSTLFVCQIAPWYHLVTYTKPRDDQSKLQHPKVCTPPCHCILSLRLVEFSEQSFEGVVMLSHSTFQAITAKGKKSKCPCLRWWHYILSEWVIPRPPHQYNSNLYLILFADSFALASTPELLCIPWQMVLGTAQCMNSWTNLPASSKSNRCSYWELHDQHLYPGIYKSRKSCSSRSPSRASKA